MKLLLLGASGGCGRWLARLGAARGHAITALVRPGSSFEATPGVALLLGDPLDPALLDAELRDQDAVLCALGIKRLHPANPWSRLVSPEDLCSRAASLLVAGMRARGVRRVIAISAAGVAESRPRMNPLMRLLVAKSNLSVAYRDLALMEETLRQSGLDWQAVRPVTLRHGPPLSGTRIVDRYGATLSISRGSVAAWMLDALESREPLTDRTPMIAAAGS